MVLAFRQPRKPGMDVVSCRMSKEAIRLLGTICEIDDTNACRFVANAVSHAISKRLSELQKIRDGKVGVAGFGVSIDAPPAPRALPHHGADRFENCGE